MKLGQVDCLRFKTAYIGGDWAHDVRIGILDGKVTSIDADVAPDPGDCVHAIGIPGIPNLHSHAFQRTLTGLTERRGPDSDSFWSWREQMYRFLDRVDPDDAQAIAALAYAEMLESGFTRVGEFHYLHHDEAGKTYGDPAEMASRIVAAAEETGVGLTLLPVFYAHSNFGGQRPSHGQRRFITDLSTFTELVEEARKHLAPLYDANLGIAPHSLRAVTPEELRDLLELNPTGPVHIHAAEQVKEVDDSLAALGMRPVEWLLDNAGLDSRWCVIHATHMTDMETERLASSGAVAGLCPITEANLGDGIFPARRYIEVGGAFGVGTDSNVAIDAMGELRQLEYGQRLSLQARNVLAAGPGSSNGAFLFQQALIGGSRALGVPSGIAVGQSADFVSLDADHPNLYGKSGDAIFDGLIFGGRRAVEHVWRRGVRVVERGRHVHRESIESRYRQVMRKLCG
jgi:formiminoglutamate deiminase